jgi:hypothetical protein
MKVTPGLHASGPIAAKLALAGTAHGLAGNLPYLCVHVTFVASQLPLGPPPVWALARAAFCPGRA